MLVFVVLGFLHSLQFLVLAAPHGDEEGSAASTRDEHRIPPESFLNSLLFRRHRSDDSALNRIPESSALDHMGEEALRRKLFWERTIHKDRAKPYPDQILPIAQEALRRSRCEALPFIQNIYKKHCVPVRIPNKFCFGQCNSFYVPGNPTGSLQPCTSCVPVLSRRISVALQCRGGRVSWQEVQLVEECDCVTRFDRVSQPGSSETQ
ncbi:DAN domain family member 5 [Spea bombifrons]|uniref:DAN domain family member 5 n=1 Tax=Spea bombifrons TaxID=233779 RepID=UPI00234A6886|nr:DAN domain family member 5 [Spea bombifrons]